MHSRIIAAAGLGIVLNCNISAAQEASFGCKVLLCAAATSPSWRAIPYCVPVMTTLLSMLRRGSGFPSCPEANASPVGYQPYRACPQDTLAVTRAGETINLDPDGRSCAPRVASGAAGAVCDAMGVCVDVSQIADRPANPDPYYVDIAPPGSLPQRLWFSLTQ